MGNNCTYVSGVSESWEWEDVVVDDTFISEKIEERIDASVPNKYIVKVARESTLGHPYEVEVTLVFSNGDMDLLISRIENSIEFKETSNGVFEYTEKHRVYNYIAYRIIINDTTNELLYHYEYQH